MNFTAIAAFEQHLKEVFPDRLESLYSVLAPDLSDQEALSRRLQNVLKKAYPDLEIVSVDFSVLSAKEIAEQLLGQSLFTKRRLYLIRGCDKKSAPLLEKMGGEERAIVLGYRIGACLDLSKEKPWDKKKRLIAYLRQKAERNGFSLDERAAEELFLRRGENVHLLENSLETLMCYAEKSAITIKDVEAVIADGQKSRSWQVSESFVFGFPLKKLTVDDPFALIGQIRYHLGIGLKICKGEQTGNLKPKTLDQYRAVCQKVGPSYFEEGLRLLFNVELQAKSTTLKPQALLETLYVRLKLIR